MSKGPGRIEAAIAELFIGTRDRALSVSVITGYAFGLDGATPTRAQRLSATRAAHRVLRRMVDMDRRAAQAYRQAHEQATAALGRKERTEGWQRDEEYREALEATSAWKFAEKTDAVASLDRFG